MFFHTNRRINLGRINLVNPQFKPTGLQHTVVGFDGSQWVQRQVGAESVTAYQL